MNQTVPLDRTSLFLSMILLLLVVLMAGGMGVYVLSDPGLTQAYTFAEVALKIAERHGNEVTKGNLITSARRAIFDRLDRYSGYVKSSQFDRIDEELSGAYGGIGVTVVRHQLGLLVMSVRENGPAGEVGLLSGDIIIGADSIDFIGINPDSAANHLRGKENTKVVVRIFRPVAADTIEIEIVRRRIPLLHIPYAGYTPDSVLYIRLLDFEAGASAEVEAALDSLINKNDAGLRGLILDLRGNPGGLFTEAYETASLFLEEGTFIVGTDARSRWKEREYHATGADVTDGLPLAVIVDRGSASSAEIVAGALRQAGRAILVGDTTFGKGLVQGYTRFPDGDGLRLTIARYYFEDNVYLNDFDSTLNDTGHGLVPDYCFPPDERRPFVQALENSLLLQRFANRRQDEIIADAEEGGLEDSWLERFILYTQQNDFLYYSLSARLAETLTNLAETEQSFQATKEMTNRILDSVRRDDRNQFHAYAAYIRTRLKQIAFERKFGTYRAYHDVVVRERPVIRFASRVLLGSN